MGLGRFFSLVLLSSFYLLIDRAHADGFQCAGDGFRVKLYDQIDPAKGTRKPAVLVLSSEEDGVISVIGSEKISRNRNRNLVTFHGEGKQGKLDVHLDLTVVNERRPEGDTTKDFDGELLVAMSDGYKIHAKLECKGYVKSGGA